MKKCKAEFRVEKRDLPTLREVLGIPPAFKCPQRTICDGMEGLCMLLKRLAYPCRYSDMITRFGRPVPELCMITNRVMDFIWCTWPPNHSVEWHYTESRINWTICHCHHRKRRSSRQLFLALLMVPYDLSPNQEICRESCTMGTREYMLSSFSRLLYLMGSLPICLALWVSAI